MKSEIRTHRYPALIALTLLATTSTTSAKTFRGTNPLRRQLQVDDSSVSCSPLIINFVLSLTQTCQDSNLRPKPGIKDTLCIVELITNEVEDDDLFPSLNRRLGIGDSLNWSQSEQDRSLQTDPTTAIPVEITSIQFLEIDDSGDLKIINQDDSMSNVDLVDGQVVSFTSITSTLDPSVPLEDQSELVPGGAALVVMGMNAGGEVVRNRMLWTYTNECGSEPCTEEDVPIDPGDKIGWVTFGDSEQARPDFCDALTESPTPAPTLPPTKVPPTGGLPKPTNPPTPCQSNTSSTKSRKSTKSGKSVKSDKSTKSGKSSTKSTKIEPVEKCDPTVPVVSGKSGKSEMEMEGDTNIIMEMSMGMYGKSSKMLKASKLDGHVGHSSSDKYVTFMHEGEAPLDLWYDVVDRGSPNEQALDVEEVP